MKKMMMILAVLFVIVGSSFAGDYLTPCAPVPTGIKIVSYFTLESGGTILILNKNHLDPFNSHTKSMVYIPPNLVGSKELKATAMAAFLNQKDIGMYASGHSILPHWGGAFTAANVLRLWMIN